MVAGHLREKSGYYYAVLNYTDSLGKRKTKWISTGLTVKGNKKRAEAILMDARRNFNPEEPKVMNGDILFADYMEKWLDIIKSSVAVPTFASYSTTVKKIVAPYFREKEVTLKNLTAKDIQEFYLSELERVSPSSVIHYHANIHKALKYAVKIDLIDVNPADKVERPKKDRYVGSFYDADEVNALFEAAKGSKLELPILFGAFYGLRRSEAIGLKWDAIDFDQNTITIRHTVTSCDLDGKRVLVASDTTKTKSSMRTLPLVPFMRERLLTLKEEQQENRRLCGRSYIKEYLEYVCVNEIGDLIKPHYVTESFPKLLKAKGMRQIRYHDSSGKRCSHEADSGMAWSQRLFNYGKHLRTSGLQLEADLCGCNAQWLGLRAKLKKKSQQPEKPTTGEVSGGAGGIRTHGTLRFN